MKMIILDELSATGTIKANVGRKFRQLLKESQIVQIVCPYISEDNENPVLKELRGKNIQIICDINSLGCNPKVVKSILELNGIDNTFVDIRYFNALHAKVYIFDNEKVLAGSANYTPNGMGNGKVENAIYIEEKVDVRKHLKWFETIWKMSKKIRPSFNWDRLIDRWEENKMHRNAPKRRKDKYTLYECLRLGIHRNDIYFTFWNVFDKGGKKIKKVLAKEINANENDFEILSDGVLNEDGKIDKPLLNELIEIENRINRKYLIVFKTSASKQYLFKGQSDVGIVFGFDYRLKDNLGCKTKCDSIMTKYLENPTIPFIVDKRFKILLDKTIRKKNDEWNDLLEKTKTFVSFNQMRRFLGLDR